MSDQAATQSLPRRLANRVALVTGGLSGIGRAVAQRFAAEGARVAVNHRKPDDPRCAEVRAALTAPAHVDDEAVLMVAGDVSKGADAEHIVAETVRKWGRLDLLVNNAGIQVERPSHELSPEDFDKVVNVNLRGAALCSLAAIRQFRTQAGGGGVILNNSSVHEIIPKPGFLGYSVSKGGLRNLTRTLALEYAAEGIRVNAVAPGVVDTPMNESLADDEARQAVLAHIPLGHIARPADIAAIFAFLATDEAACITGQTIFVDAGLTMYPGFRENWSSD
jgi:glucose 1-dehydrogenase